MFVNPSSTKTQDKILISQCIFKNLKCWFKMKAESTYIQHKQTMQYFPTAVNMEQKQHWKQHQKNRVLDLSARVHLEMRMERLVQQQAPKTWRKPWLIFLSKKRSLNFKVLKECKIWRDDAVNIPGSKSFQKGDRRILKMVSVMSHTWISQAVSLQLKENRKKWQRINLGHD